MIIQQVSVFAENKPGKLLDILSVLNENKVNMLALSVADTSDFGIIRMIVDDAENARDIFKKNGFTSKLTPVLAVKVSNEPGVLFHFIKKISDANINIEYTYAFAEPCSQEQRVVLKVDDAVAAQKIVSNE